MKSLFLIGSLSLFMMCTPQKQKTMAMVENNATTTAFSEQEFLFYSAFTGGSQQRGFKILNNQTELNQAIQGNQMVLQDGLSSAEPQLKFPEHQKVILFNLGEFRSGDHQPKGIESTQVVDGVLEVKIKKSPPSQSPDREMAIQVISTPYMIFSVPENYEFKNVILK
ncbi:hypothetical protein [Riemerella columbina]|uniref:hypothetical protein n=1 Tax=Riemerella columbina TaxID=103810 RepID=UPI00266FDD93|nr:hypothetical protein [Riemerella columbina]WKS96048.1 hypothetical protein NYR17_04765 [Riemerella columbina]